ncbi:MAG: molybdenum ABC transporter ATP-binding protein [Alphaproteobacteria bacterium]
MLEVDIGLELGQFRLNAAFESGSAVTALFGRSGAGKSTIVKAIGGLVRPARGRITLGGEVLFDAKANIDVSVQARRIGHVFQDARLFPHLSVGGNLRYGGRFAPRPPSRAQTGEVVDLLGISHLLDRRPATLSGGEKQRIAIARALLMLPRALIMDEPLASLDARRKADILPYLDRLSSLGQRAGENPMPIIYVSHALDEVTRLATTMVVIEAGRVVAQGSTEAIMSRVDLHPFTGQRDTGALLTAQVVAHDEFYQLTELALAGQSLKVARIAQPVGAKVRLQVLARDVTLSVVRPKGQSTRNILKGKISALKLEKGAHADIAIAVSDQILRARITRQAVDDLALHPGARIYALVKTVAVERRLISPMQSLKKPKDDKE